MEEVDSLSLDDIINIKMENFKDNKVTQRDLDKIATPEEQLEARIAFYESYYNTVTCIANGIKIPKNTDSLAMSIATSDADKIKSLVKKGVQHGK